MLSKDAYAEIEGEWKTFRFRRIEPADYDAVFDHISKYFVRDEPTCQLFGYSDDFAADISRLVAKMLKDELSFLAEDINTGEIAGVRVNFHHTKDTTFEDVPFNSTKTKNLVKLLEELEISGNVPERLGLDNWAEFFIASTAPKYRQQGLAGEFYKRSIEFLKECGFKFALVIVSSPFTRAATQRQGFQELSSLKYNNFLDIDGNLAFRPEQLKEEHFACLRFKTL